ncbi:hypothetical protein, partial [Crossiella equi]
PEQSRTSPTSARGGELPPGSRFPAGTRQFGRTVHANGFAFRLASAEARKRGASPEVVLRLEVTNQVHRQPIRVGTDIAPPPYLKVRGTSAIPQGNTASPVARGSTAVATFTYLVNEDFQWSDAVVDFPVFGQGVNARIPLDGSRSEVLAPGSLEVTGPTLLVSGQQGVSVARTGLYRADVHLSDGWNDYDVDSSGLPAGKGSFSLRFALVVNGDRSGVRFGRDNFTLTAPNGRRFTPQHVPVLVSPGNARTEGTLAALVDLPAAGTYKLTFQVPGGPAASTTFVVRVP